MNATQQQHLNSNVNVTPSQNHSTSDIIKITQTSKRLIKTRTSPPYHPSAHPPIHTSPRAFSLPLPSRTAPRPHRITHFCRRRRRSVSDMKLVLFMDMSVSASAITASRWLEVSEQLSSQCVRLVNVTVRSARGADIAAELGPPRNVGRRSDTNPARMGETKALAASTEEGKESGRTEQKLSEPIAQPTVFSADAFYSKHRSIKANTCNNCIL